MNLTFSWSAVRAGDRGDVDSDVARCERLQL